MDISKDKGRINIEIDKELKKQLQYLCIDKELTITNFVEGLIKKAVDEHRGKGNVIE